MKDFKQLLLDYARSNKEDLGSYNYCSEDTEIISVANMTKTLEGFSVSFVCKEEYMDFHVEGQAVEIVLTDLLAWMYFKDE